MHRTRRFKRNGFSTPGLAHLPTRKFPTLLKHGVGSWRRRHQKPVAAGDQPLDVSRIRVGMAAGDIMLLAYFKNRIDSIGDHRMIVVSRVT
jgi:hypothetical protein